MPRQNSIQTSWTKGEVSPLSRGRVDVNLYAAGAETVENFIIRPQGPLFRRSGSKYILTTRDSATKSRLIPFELSDVAGYELLFGDNYIWVLKDRFPIIDTTTSYDEAITAIGNSSGNFLITATPNNRAISTITNNGSGKTRCTTSTAHGYRTGSTVQITGTGYGSLDNLSFSVTYVSTTAFDITTVNYPGAGTGAAKSCLVRSGDPVIISGSVAAPGINGTWVVKSVAAYNQYVLAHSTYAAPGGGANGSAYPWIVEVATTFDELELVDINYAQSADVMYLAHEDHAPSKIQRDNDNEWSIVDVEFKDGPYLPVQQTSFVDFAHPENGTQFPDVLLYVSSYAHTATINVDVGFAADSGDPGTDPDDIGKYIEYREGDQWRLGLLTAAAAGALTGTITVIDNVLLHLDETTLLKSRGQQQMVPGSTGSSPAIATGRNGETGASGNSRPTANVPSQKKLDPRDELQAPSTVIKSQYSNTFGYQDVGKYVRYHTSDAAATAAWAKITGLVIGGSGGGTGKDANRAAALTMASNNATANAVVSAHSRTSYVTAFEGQIDAGFASGLKNIFTTSDIGRKIRIGFGGRWAWGHITALVGAIGGITPTVQVTWEVDLPRDTHNAENIAGNHDSGSPATGWTYDWRLGAWGIGTDIDYGIFYTIKGAGYPRTVCFHEQRLVWGGSRNLPQTFWMSVSGDFENMIPSELDSTVLDDSAITYTLASAKANAIKWMISGPSLTIGTNGGEWQVRASTSVNDPITPANIKAVDYTSHGCAAMLPARIGPVIVFVDRSLERVRELSYSAVEERYESDDISVISEHILRDHDGAVGTCYQQNPHSVFWIWCGDGTISAVTINKKQEVIAWHHHTIASGTVESMSSIPSTDGTKDEVWMVVKRTISGATLRTVELLEDDFYPTSSSSRLGMRFADGHRVISSWTSTAIAGLNHLEGLSVIPIVDGTAQAAKTVSSGAITLDSAAASEVVVGLAFNSNLESLPPEGGSQFGTSQGQTKKVIYLDTRILNSRTISFGKDASSLVSKTLPVTSPSVWFTGTNRLVPKTGFDEESKWYIRQSDPYPLNILFVVTKLETNE